MKYVAVQKLSGGALFIWFLVFEYKKGDDRRRRYSTTTSTSGSEFGVKSREPNVIHSSMGWKEWSASSLA
jgi:hypothetical protein